MRRDAAVDEAEARFAAAGWGRERYARHRATRPARDIDIVGIDIGIGVQLCELPARAGEAAPFGDAETREIEVEAFDAFAIDQREALNCRAKPVGQAELATSLTAEEFAAAVAQAITAPTPQADATAEAETADANKLLN
jgi:hypothetical protein